MKRIIIMLAGALLATTAHAQQTPATIDDVERIVDVAVTKLTNEVRAQPKGRRIAMYYSEIASLEVMGPLRLLGSSIDGIAHTDTGVTVPAGTYLLTLDMWTQLLILYAGTGNPLSPSALEIIPGGATPQTIATGRQRRTETLVSYAAPTRIYVGTDRKRAATFLLTIEQLD